MLARYNHRNSTAVNFPSGKGSSWLASLGVTCFLQDWHFRHPLCWPVRPGVARRPCSAPIPTPLPLKRCRRRAARATALRLRLEVSLRQWRRSRRDLGFGLGQGDFAKTGEFEFAKAKFDDSKWRTLNLPHDWAVELPFVRRRRAETSHGFKPLGRRYPETSVGWYRREFEIPASRSRPPHLRRIRRRIPQRPHLRQRLLHRPQQQRLRALPFRHDRLPRYGAKNYIVVRVDASFGDGWFYEGAGIYRHVWLTKTDPLHLGRWEAPSAPTVRRLRCPCSAPLLQNQGKQPETATRELANPRRRRQDRRHRWAAAQTIAVDGTAHFSATASARQSRALVSR